jgi:dTDP-4-dehydrorhamnose reductase
LTVLVVGAGGQLARSLLECGARHGLELAAAGLPEFDLTDIASVEQGIARAAPALVINAAAYTAVDKAESEPEAARAVNAIGAGQLAATCEQRGIPLIHVSTDYVFDGRKASRYEETDPVQPINAYGRSKLEGEQRVAAACSRHVLLRTAWLYSPFGQNFAKTMLRLAARHAEIDVVDDQIGCPTYAPHLADAVLGICSSLHRRGVKEPWGIYHAAGTGEATWCGFAREIFRCSAAAGGPSARVRPITTAEFPTPAARPANSRLDCGKLSRVFGLALPDWRTGTAACISRLLAATQESP